MPGKSLKNNLDPSKGRQLSGDSNALAVRIVPWRAILLCADAGLDLDCGAIPFGLGGVTDLHAAIRCSFGELIMGMEFLASLGSGEYVDGALLVPFSPSFR